ncbi:MAG: hypothetical protein LBS21_01470 [Clostridiales bacterium]|jgi:uncharacterized phage protein gp47/JayE|nr:hypothetical protein [Clostridiales bacterium]
MQDYGITPKGVVIKRLDEIISEIHDDLTEGWGVNTRLNPKSYLNVQLTAFADKIAELWELGEQIYHSKYPFSAEGMSLDNAVQYGMISREGAKPTYYPIHCTCVDGTVIPKGAMLKSDTNPSLNFIAPNDTEVTRSAFNSARIRVAARTPSSAYTVALDGILYNYTAQEEETEADIINNLARKIKSAEFVITTEADPPVIVVSSSDKKESHELILSGNLTTVSVTGLVTFASEYNGEISLPDNTITQIATAVPGFLSAVNQVPYIAGRLLQDDAGLRKSYADKIYHMSNRMLESIRSAILQNVQGVKSVAVYQNDTNLVDAFGRWPHCVEVVIDGGGDLEIAQQIWNRKTDGIQTFGSTEVAVTGDEGEPVIIRFNRPEFVFVWYQITVSLNRLEVLPPNYVEAITDIVTEEMFKIAPGKPIIPQKMIDSKIYATVPGIAFIETKTFYTTNNADTPEEYLNGVIPISPRQRAVTDESRIEVLLDG